eukprot:sb/3478000/
MGTTTPLSTPVSTTPTPVGGGPGAMCSPSNGSPLLLSLLSPYPGVAMVTGESRLAPRESRPLYGTQTRNGKGEPVRVIESGLRGKESVDSREYKQEPHKMAGRI